MVGIVVFLLISLVKTPPRVSIPRERGVTSRRSTSVTSPASTPPNHTRLNKRGVTSRRSTSVTSPASTPPNHTTRLNKREG